MNSVLRILHAGQEVRGQRLHYQRHQVLALWMRSAYAHLQQDLLSLAGLLDRYQRRFVNQRVHVRVQFHSYWHFRLL